jgi:hypothetical protein
MVTTNPLPGQDSASGPTAAAAEKTIGADTGDSGPDVGVSVTVHVSAAESVTVNAPLAGELGTQVALELIVYCPVYSGLVYVHAAPVVVSAALAHATASGPTNWIVADTGCSGPDDGVSVAVHPSAVESETAKPAFEAELKEHVVEDAFSV